MGIYVNPHDDVQAQGRQLTGSTYEELLPQLKSGEVLVGQFDRGMFKNSPVLFSKEEFNEFHGQVEKGIIWLLGYFAMPLDYFDEHDKAFLQKCGF